jgi:hypothetical protein
MHKEGLSFFLNDSGATEGRQLFSLAGEECGYKGKEIAAFLGKDPAAVTGYLKRGQDLFDKMKRIIFSVDGMGRKLNN